MQMPLSFFPNNYRSFVAANNCEPPYEFHDQMSFFSENQRPAVLFFNNDVFILIHSLVNKEVIP